MKKNVKVLALVICIVLSTISTASAIDQQYIMQTNQQNAQIKLASEIVASTFDYSNVETGQLKILNETYQEITDDNNVSISFNNSGDIVRINALHSDNDVVSVADPAEIKADVFELFDLSNAYKTTEYEMYCDDYLGYSYIKEYDNGLQNPFESVKIVCDSTTSRPVLLTEFSLQPNTIQPTISEQDALLAAKQSVYYSAGSVLTDCELTFVCPSMFLNDNVDRYDDEYSYLTYELTFDDEYMIFVDATDAYIIGVDVIMAYNSASFVINEVSETDYPKAVNRRNSSAAVCKELNAYRNNNLKLTEKGFRQLGYTAIPQNNPYTTSSLLTDMKNYVTGSNSYGFYFCGHGSPNVIGYKYGTYLRRENVSGNWRFVFLDACSTGEDSGWAEAFKIYGYADRAFLGWYKEVSQVNTHLFHQYFWPRVGTMAIRELALEAANTVPGSGTTPIRFHGDQSYDGNL